ncbi:hypothetical protein Tco_0173372 [Tanacetum coccineum]
MKVKKGYFPLFMSIVALPKEKEHIEVGIDPLMMYMDGAEINLAVYSWLRYELSDSHQLLEGVSICAVE